MKKLFLSLVAMMIATMSFAQTSLLATLSHEGSVSTFYGATALKQAMEKAETGDAITLSAGQFLAADITKAVTLRGAGMRVRNDSEMSHGMTVVEGDFSVNITEETEKRLIMEGLYFSSTMTNNGIIRNAMFMKTRFYGVVAGEGSKMVNTSFIHCRMANYGIKITDDSNVSMINSVVLNPNNESTTTSNFEFDNCVISGNVESVINSYYKNCFINSNMTVKHNEFTHSVTSGAIPSSNVALNCVGYAKSDGFGSNDIFYYINSMNTSNKNVTNLSSVLKSGNVSYSDSEMYELTDDAKTTYLGLDGTQIGIYGGNLPYEEDPITPQIVKCNVAAKSTADGKLSVEIEVKAAEY